MAAGATKKKPVGKTIFYGLLTAALYAAVFSYSDAVLQIFTRVEHMRRYPLQRFSFFRSPTERSQAPVVGPGDRSHYPTTAKRPAAPAPRPAQRPRPRVRLSV